MRGGVKLATDVCLPVDSTEKLWASPDAVDTDFTSMLIDVYPPGPTRLMALI